MLGNAVSTVIGNKVVVSFFIDGIFLFSLGDVNKFIKNKGIYRANKLLVYIL